MKDLDPDLEGKSCSKCETYKPLSDYSKNPHARDGLHNACNNCRSEIEYNRRKSSQAAKYERSRVAASADKIADAPRCIHRQTGHVNQHGESVTDKVKALARKQVVISIRSGLIPSQQQIACANCGHTAADYHHLCYQCNIVVPLCSLCHSFCHIPDTLVSAEDRLWGGGFNITEILNLSPS